MEAEFVSAELQVVNLPEISALLQTPEHVSRGYWIVKRCFDVALALAILVFASPLLGLIVVAIKIDSKGPVFFHQTRVGRRLNWFKIHKFRTMHEDVSPVPVAIYDPALGKHRRPRSSEDLRVTRVGRILRRFSLDELPQIINVLLGEMSFIGPRPLTITESMATPVPALARYSVPAGISGLAQVRDRSAIGTPSRFLHDIEYVKTVSWRVDLKILLATFSRMYDRG